MGFVGNINYLQMIDLAAGFMGIDVCGDDGRRYGLWPWETQEREASAYAQQLHKDVLGLPLKPEKVEEFPATSGYWGRGNIPLPAKAAKPPVKK